MWPTVENTKSHFNPRTNGPLVSHNFNWHLVQCRKGLILPTEWPTPSGLVECIWGDIAIFWDLIPRILTYWHIWCTSWQAESPLTSNKSANFLFLHYHCHPAGRDRARKMFTSLYGNMIMLCIDLSRKTTILEHLRQLFTFWTWGPALPGLRWCGRWACQRGCTPRLPS